MKNSYIKAWSIGASTLIAVFTIWFVLLQANVFSQSVVFLLWVSPMIAAFVSAYLSPSHKILLGTSMAIPSALLAVTLNLAGQFFADALESASSVHHVSKCGYPLCGAGPTLNANAAENGRACMDSDPDS